MNSQTRMYILIFGFIILIMNIILLGKINLLMLGLFLVFTIGVMVFPKNKKVDHSDLLAKNEYLKKNKIKDPEVLAGFIKTKNHKEVDKLKINKLHQDKIKKAHSKYKKWKKSSQRK